MSGRTPRGGKRRFIGSVDQLDDRVLLTVGPVPSVTSAASAAQSIAVAPAVSPLLTLAFDSAVGRLNGEFIGQAQALDNLLIARIQHYEALYASNAASSEARIERALGRHSTIRPVRAAMTSALLNAQVAHQEAYFKAKSARLAATFENQMANLAGTFEQTNAQFAIPTSAFFANIQSAATAFSSEVASALTSVTSSLQSGSVAVNALLNNPALASSSQFGSGALVGTLPTFPQAFNSAFTQALAALTANLQGVTSALQQDFGSFQTQFSANASSLTSSFNLAPFGSFGVLPAFAMGTTSFAGPGDIGTATNSGAGTTSAAGSPGTTGLGPATS